MSNESSANRWSQYAPVSVAVLGLYLVVAIAQTYPLILKIRSHIPLGNYPAETTARFNLWTLWWNSECLKNAYRSIWSAPIFVPDTNAFAYSEPQWLTGLAFSVVRLLAGSESFAFAYNVVLIVGLTLNGWCAYILFSRLTVPTSAAVAGGLLLQLLPTIWDQLGVIQSVFLFPLYMMLACSINVRPNNVLRRLMGVALWSVVCFHISSNTALYFAPALCIAFIILACRQLLHWKALLSALAAAVVTATCVLPIAKPQEAVLRQLQSHRPEWITVANSASWWDYLKMPSTNILCRRPMDRKGFTLCPSMSIAFLSFAGAIYGLTQPHLRRVTAVCLIIASLYLLLSFGPKANMHSPVLGAPYNLLRDYVPGFRYARNPWRFGALGQVFLAIPAGLAFAGLANWKAHKKFGVLLVSVIVLVPIGELLAFPVPLVAVQAAPPHDWVRWLKEQPDGVRVVHLPMAAGLTPEEYQQTTVWMSQQMYHGKAMANGYSGFVPDHASLLAKVMEHFPSEDGIRLLRQFGITHVMADASWMNSDNARRLGSWASHLPIVFDSREMTIFEIRDP